MDMTQNINIGGFTLVATLDGTGWAVPGGRIEYNAKRAERIARIFAGRMRG
jgi:ADP-ribose pyrophosphatase YjhB (NUDIX family)